MTSESRRQRMRSAVRRALLTLVALFAVALGAFLPFAGRYLDNEDLLQPADAVFVLAGARAERWLEAVDVYKAGYAPRIVLSPGRTEPAEDRVRALGIRYPMDTEQSLDAIVQFGIPPDAIEILPGVVDNTAQEAGALHLRASGAGWHRLIVVTSKYHCRRARFAFAREFAGTGVVILLRASRYDSSDPGHWWRDRAEVRWVTSELEKLVAYRFGLRE